MAQKKKNLFTALAVAVSLTVGAPLLSGCMSSTTTNSTTTNRNQIMLVSEQEVTAEAQKQYAEVLAQAKQQGALNTDKKQTKRVQKIAKRLIAAAPTYRADAKNWQWEVNVCLLYTSDAADD